VETTASTFRLTALWPQPSSGRFNVSFMLSKGGPALLELYDLGGRLVERRQIDFNGSRAQSARLGDAHVGTGVYLVRLAQGLNSAQAKAIVLK
jgi:hypothetical protein